MCYKVVIEYARGDADAYEWPSAFSAGSFYGRAIQTARLTEKSSVRKITALEGERVLAEWVQ